MVDQKKLTFIYNLKKNRRGIHGYSLIETMAVLVVLGIVMGLLYGYSNSGWKLFFQSYSRGLSQVKARLAVKVLSDDLIDANKARIEISRGLSFGIPIPDDVKDSSPFIYFTKPVFYDPTGDVISYDYVLYYFAKPKENIDLKELYSKRNKPTYLILKSIKFKNQSKTYTEDVEKDWPFLPPILELYKSTLPADDIFLESLKLNSQLPTTSSGIATNIPSSSGAGTQGNSIFLDHFALLKSVRRNIPISGNFTATALTDPFTNEQVSFTFGQDYKNDQTIKIKVSIEEPPLYVGIMAVMSDFEVKITPRN